DPTVGERSDLVIVAPSGCGIDSDIDIGFWNGDGDRARAGQLAGLAIEKAVELAMNGEVQGIVTAPIDKAALLAGGYDFPGHTEMLAELTHSKVAMMLASERLRVVLATTHMPLRDVIDAVNETVIVETAEITRDALSNWFGIEEPRIA